MLNHKLLEEEKHASATATLVKYKKEVPREISRWNSKHNLFSELATKDIHFTVI